MIYLYRKLFGRLALILLFQAVTAWFLMMAAHAVWPRGSSTLGMVITIFVMFLTVFSYQERKLGTNITWLTTLPLAKNQVWLLNYVVRFSAVTLVFGLLILIAALLPDTVYTQNHSRPFISEFFGSLGESVASWLNFYGLKIGDPANHTLSKSMIFVMILGVTHFYCGMLRLISGQGKVLNIVLFAGGLWAGFILLAVARSSVFTYEAFMMLMAAVLMMFSSLRVLQLPLRASGPMATIICLGWIVLIAPQVVRAWNMLKDPATVDDFVDAAGYFGQTVSISPEMFHRAFRRPSGPWQLRELANLYTKTNNWNNKPVLAAEGDQVFNFLDTLKAQKNQNAAFTLVQMVKPETLTARHIKAFTDLVLTLERGTQYDRPEYLATLVTLTLSDQQLTQWLNSNNSELRAAAIVYPRFKPSERNWRLLVSAYNSGAGNFSREDLDRIRISASIIKGKWLESSEMRALDASSLFAQQVNRKVCTETFRSLLCSTANSCSRSPQPEIEGCYAQAGVTAETMNACLYTFSLDNDMYVRSNLIESGWINAGRDHEGIITNIGCRTDQDYRE
jgi:hypothetical protein